MKKTVRHALSYPFPAPDHSYLFEEGDWQKCDAARVDRSDRVPVLAAGSNQSPEQLARKYAGFSDIGPILAQRGSLADFDVVYAAHLAGYGSLPATFQASPGTRVTVFVLWLNEAQLARMHETEGNYFYDCLSGIDVRFDEGGSLTEAFAYTARTGCFRHDNAPVALAEIAAGGRVFRRCTQIEAQSLARDQFAPGMAIEEFIAGTIENADLRRARAAALAANAIPPDFARRTLLDLGD